MNTRQYIDTVLLHVKNKAYRKDIEAELMSHIEEREEYYLEIGWEKETASAKALENMGDPKQVGEEMNRIHSNTPALLVCVVLMLVFLLVIAYYFTDYNFIDFAVISTDSEVITVNGLIISFLTFASGALSFRMAYKNRFAKTAVFLGIIYLLSIFSICIYLPAGNSIFGFFFDYPAVFIEKEFYFFQNEISWGIDAYISNPTACIILGYIELFLIALFFLSGMVNAVFSIKMGIDMFKGNFERRERYYRRFSVILCVLTAVCAFTMTAEIATDYIKTQNYNDYFQQSENSDFEQAQDIFESINVPLSDEEALELSLKSESFDSYLYTPEDYVLMIEENPHYNIFVYDDDHNGIFETKRIFSTFDGNLTEKDCKKITDEMTSQEVIDKIGFKNISDYTYTVENGNVSEIISLEVKNSIFNECDYTYYVFYFENSVQTYSHTESV